MVDIACVLAAVADVCGLRPCGSASVAAGLPNGHGQRNQESVADPSRTAGISAVRLAGPARLRVPVLRGPEAAGSLESMRIDIGLTHMHRQRILDNGPDPETGVRCHAAHHGFEG